VNNSSLFNRPFLILIISILALVSMGSRLFFSALAQCSSTQSTDMWAPGTKVYVNISGLDDEQQRQIKLAVSEWNKANESNNSGITFTIGTPPSTNTAILTFQNGTSDGSNGATMKPVSGGNDSPMTEATITFWIQGKTPGGNPIFDPKQAGYDTIFLKMALHEIGHTMGLDEAPVPSTGYCDQTNGASIMNGYCGTNDQGAIIPHQFRNVIRRMFTCNIHPRLKIMEVVVSFKATA
jgi:hypothetical protein